MTAARQKEAGSLPANLLLQVLDELGLLLLGLTSESERTHGSIDVNRADD